MANIKESLKATYIQKKDLHTVEDFLVELEATGKWSGTDKPTELFLKCKGEVLEKCTR